MPFDGHESLLVQVFLENWSICWLYDAPAALLGPVAEATSIPAAINSFEHEWFVDTSATLYKLLPIL